MVNKIYDVYTERTDLSSGQKWALRNPDAYARSILRQNNARKNRRWTDPVAHILNEARSNAKEYGREFNLDRTDIVIPERCPILGIPLFFVEGSRIDNTPSLDRINNNKGYIKGNVCVVSWRANRLKGEMSRNEIEALWRYVNEQH